MDDMKQESIHDPHVGHAQRILVLAVPANRRCDSNGPVSLVFPSTSYGYPTLRTQNPNSDPSNSRRSTRAGFGPEWVELGGIERVKIADTGHADRARLD